MKISSLIIFGAIFVTSNAILFKNEEDLTHIELLRKLRPSLSSPVQGMLDEILKDPAVQSFDDVNNWQMMEMSLSVLMRNSTFKSIIMQEGMKRLQQQNEKSNANLEFPCKISPRNKTATSVHELTPGDVNVVAAMGDSITAGTGISAKTVIGILLQYKGESWAVGGDDDFDRNPTFPNILRKYNKAIYGYSTGLCRSSGACAKMNVAIPGKTARDMSAQARDLIQRMQADPVVDFENDWKVVTIFIGQNDICSSSCKHPTTFTAEMYSKRLRDALEILYNEMPRTFVNLVSMVDAYMCRDLNVGSLCTLLHVIECPCGGFNLYYEETRALNEAYQHETRLLAKEYERKPRNDFTVVVQPFFEETVLPRTSDGKVDMSYFAPDCFHFNAKGHAAGALSLWNNMLEPVGQKKTSWHQGEPYKCPTPEQPYFCTSKNCGLNSE